MRHLARRLISWLPFIAQVALCVAVLSWCAGRILTDRYTWSQWLWWTPTPVTLVLLLSGAIIALLSAPPARWRVMRRAAWAIGLMLGIVYFTMIEHRFLHAPDADVDGIEIVHWTCTMAAPHERAAHVEWARTFTGDLAILMHTAGLSFDPGMAAVRDRGFHTYPVGLATAISRMPLIEHRVIVRSGEYAVRLMRFDRLDGSGEQLALWLVDLPSDPRLPRWDVATRLRELLDSAGEAPPDLIIGDFNMQRGSASRRAIFPSHAHAFDEVGHGYGATYPRDRPFLHIDHVLTTDRLTVLRYDIEDPGHGRHRRQRFIIAR